MTEQTFNPLRITPGAVNDAFVCDNFRNFVGQGLMMCWLGLDAENPGSNCAFDWSLDYVQELRDYFLNLVETVIVTLWKGQYKPGDGDIDGDWQSVVVNGIDEEGRDWEDAILTWYIRLDMDAMMFELDCTGGSPQVIWLDYKAIEDACHVATVLAEARKEVGGNVYEEILKIAHGQRR